MIEKAKTFLNESFAELKRVNWPTRKETMRLTMVVAVLSLAVSGLLGFFDMFFEYLLSKYII
ncbi:MAG: preprotein translocase subunit SecE [Candidatus Liptonbacteria bacterium RIFOXYC1_FULL_36_8]|uniref:Protein translocase subunit SecE n=3 Tax=Candidatus Liptoniibacteriota TaxID=1817909 RepID=A0A1G2CP92_9BACT|nr:MAG: preprotein translocase subunit SecE [Candidatus Liptonbacteria bacterium RIFOXYD1_FULL_36_11]OGZ03071.1 MAG: preprotein translocase subunit SecE [Candidatus Liptonbacteria bacterium RIFOXYC1_FULL_36_8]OGZ03203.1 MAG: preprotein translocase subunit SecE [Candidatus Liptonbacteria bacterium RIFOXYB1_FULL_36_10]